jgi:photosystem II stability/assembly factor-like uncharacterized protein
MRRSAFIYAFFAAGISLLAVGPAPTSVTQTYSISGRIVIDGRERQDGVIVWIDLDHVTDTDNLGDYHIYDVFFTDSETGTAVGLEGTILQTTDGGETWVGQTSGTSSALRDVVFTDTNTGTVVGDDGTVLRTTDGSDTWIQQVIPTSINLHSVSFANENVGTIVGHDGWIFWTDKGGGRWLPLESGTANNLYGVFFTDANTGTVVGTYGTILRTTGGGTSSR